MALLAFKVSVVRCDSPSCGEAGKAGHWVAYEVANRWDPRVFAPECPDGIVFGPRPVPLQSRYFCPGIEAQVAGLGALFA